MITDPVHDNSSSPFQDQPLHCAPLCTALTSEPMMKLLDCFQIYNVILGKLDRVDPLIADPHDATPPRGTVGWFAKREFYVLNGSA